MDNYIGNTHDNRLGVNKIGKNIRKSPPHQPNFTNPPRQPPPPQVYNINKNDFRNIVQQLTGSPSHHSQEPLPRPPLNPRNPSSNRLQRIRPPRLAPINVARPQMPVHPGSQMPPRPGQYGQPQPPPMTGPTTAESPISAYMRYLQNSIVDPTQGVYGPRIPSPRVNRPPPPFPFPRMAGPPSPNSPFFMPSPSGYLNLISPISPYPLLSPGYQQFPPLTPSFSFSPMGQPGILGPGPQAPPSPGMGFPSPGFFNLSSPRWRG